MYATVGYWDGKPVGTETYYPLGHFSKFVRPGAVRALTSTTDANLKVTLFRHTNSPVIADRFVVQMINTGGNYSYPTLTTSSLWAADPLQRAWKVFKTADDGSTQFRLTLDEAESGAGLTGNKSLVLPPYSITTAIINNGFASSPTNITYVLTNNQLRLLWPASHRGWILQSQTSGLATGLQSNWTDVPGSGAQTEASVVLNPTNSAVFFRLRYP
jgi:hypothetical protein